MEEAIAGGGKVLVHCAAGINRGPALVAAFLVTRKRYSVATVEYSCTFTLLPLAPEAFHLLPK
jgi:predicted protein tyrosine phosphatase